MMKQKLLTLFLALAASVGVLFAQSGTCGANLTWTLDSETGVLTISGTGAMTNYTYNISSGKPNTPWYSYRESIKTVKIPNSVTSIGDWTFNGCSNLTSITIPNSVTTIGNHAFYNCSSLTSVTIPNSVTTIGNHAFQYCSKLTSVTIPNSVTSIGDYAFQNCISLTSVTIPNSVTSIGNYAFQNCFGLTSIVVENGNTKYDSRNNCNAIIETATNTLIAGCQTTIIPNSVTSIGSYAFYCCTSLTSVTIPNSVTSIGSYAFYCCTSLTSVTIPNSVTTIGNSAFYYCTGLTSITIPNSVTSIGSGAFAGCSGLTSVTIPNSVTSIGGYAFGYCSSLTSVTIGNSVTSIGEQTFQDCTSLTSITIPNSVTHIGWNAFEDCSSLTSVTIGNSVTCIYEQTFYNCSSLTSVIIPNSVTSIRWGAFSYCYSLKSIIIPNSVTSIGLGAFELCIALTSITIPNSVTSIERNAFNDCTSLKSVIMESATPPTVGRSAFNSTTPIYVPLGALKAYQEDDNWKNYNLREFDTSYKTSAACPTSATIIFSASINGANKNNYIGACGIEEGEEFSGNTVEYIGLEPESEYANIPFYIRTTKGDVQNVTVSFTTSALTLKTQQSQPVSANTAILLAETNMSDAETSCGFEWKRNDAPADMPATQVLCPVANGLMAGRLKGLKDDVYYKYRAFYMSAAGNYYYGDWQYIFTGDVTVEFDPILYTYAAQFVTERTATVKGYALAGSEDFTEQGFEYWADSRTANAPSHRAPQYEIGEKHTVKASGISMRVTLNDLDEGTVYKYRTYAKVGNKTLYGTEMSFTTQGTYEEPVVTDLEAVNDADDADGDDRAPSADAPQARKVMENNRVYIILPDGRQYDLQGKAIR